MKEINWEKELARAKAMDEEDRIWKEGGSKVAAIYIIAIDILWVLPMLILGGYFDEPMNILKWMATVFVIICEVFVVIMNKKDPSDEKKEGDS